MSFSHVNTRRNRSLFIYSFLHKQIDFWANIINNFNEMNQLIASILQHFILLSTKKLNNNDWINSFSEQEDKHLPLLKRN